MTGILQNQYLSAKPVSATSLSGQVEWKCPSNIALIKYWGKKPYQIPLNPSVSFSLSECYTVMKLEYSFNSGHQFQLDFQFNNKRNPHFSERLTKYFESITPYLPFLKNTIIRVNAANSFPHSAGIASSASSFGALALSLCSIEEAISGNTSGEDNFFRKASFLARLGSGSAARSVYGGIVLWGETADFPASSNEVAIPLENEINVVFRDYRDSILVVSSDPKSISSSAGHKLMEDHPYRAGRITQANRNFAQLMNSLKSGELDVFIDIVENEAMSLHSLIQSSRQPAMLLKPKSLEIITRIRDFRRNTGLPVGFTLDAGPNVHVLYPNTIAENMVSFIEKELRQYCENGKIIHDKVGTGPEKKA
jgi:diphosphomevalonate decarboxylase